ncbi:MAG: IS200/IS605 family transposase [Bacteroidetes bacterium]|nr:IS200/IS605 family transposase [Bacteroidota bacterium]
MPDSFTQVHIQIVFWVSGKYNLIEEQHRDEVEKYICGILKNNKCKPLAIYCNPEHIHVLIGLSPEKSISEIMRLIKCNSSKFINEKHWLPGEFQWQRGYGAFSYSKEQIDGVINYIMGQKEHHRKISFQEEFLEILDNLGFEFDRKYLFKPQKED